MKLGKWYLVNHNCVPIGIFSDYNGQLHFSACIGHLQVVLGELNLRSYYKHSARAWCRDLYIRSLFATSKATLWRCARQVWWFCSCASSMLNMFRILIHSSSRACNFYIVSPHLYRTYNQYGDTIEKSQAPDDGCINIRNTLSIEEVKSNLINCDIKLVSYSSNIRGYLYSSWEYYRRISTKIDWKKCVCWCVTPCM